MISKLKILFFTGAGISAESGLQTFRDAKDGLWNNYEIENVCTPEGWIIKKIIYIKIEHGNNKFNLRNSNW